jgi:hypothetical protein
MCAAPPIVSKSLVSRGNLKSSEECDLMTYTPLASGLLFQQLKRKIFVSYYHGGDQAYYDTFSTTFCDTYDVISDTSLERRIDSDNVEYVMRRIREDYITGSSCTVLLVGPYTWGRKYVDWETKATLEKEHGLIAVFLPTAPITPQNTIVVPDRLNDNLKTGYALWVSWNSIVTSTQDFASLIELANSRDKKLIRNNRDRRLHNA